jgi:CheY-like chemotaxis protein
LQPIGEQRVAGAIANEIGNTIQNHDEDRHESKDRYLAMLSHDLRSAISNVISSLNLMKDDDLRHDAAKLKQGALNSAWYVSQLVDGILDIRAIDDDDILLEISSVNLSDFLQNVHQTWSARIANKELILNISQSEDAPKDVEIDGLRVMRILGNLIDNAVKYTEKGHIGLHVSVSADDTLIFSVTDTGPGFSDEARARLFEFRGRPDSASQPGSGLGLHIAKSLVDLMAGLINVENMNPNGARVTLSIPGAVKSIASPHTAPRSNSSVSVLPTAVLPDLSHLHILIAEDNSTNQLVVTQMLDAMGASYDLAADGAEAIEYFETGSYQLALLDIEMPRKDGLDVIRHIRQCQDNRMHMPIIALTAYALREHRDKISQAGADGIIAKPILGIESFGQTLLSHCKSGSGAAQCTSKQTVQAAANHHTIDMEIYNRLEASIGPDMIAELLRNVAADLTSVRNRIQAGTKSGDLTEIASASHVLISVGGAIGATEAQNAGQMLNRAAHLKDTEQVELQSRACLHGIADVLNFVDDRLKS